MKLSEMTKDERSLLLYFESQCVDYGGLLQSERMNEDDFKIAHAWNETEFVKFGRIAYHDIESMQKRTPSITPKNHWCVLSDEAWSIAHEERRARFGRIDSKIDVERIGLTVAQAN